MTDPLAMDDETAEYMAAQVREWSKWEAREDISPNGVRAYNVGDPVPQSNVDRHGYAKAGQVRLQAAWVEDNPDDDDVRRFLAWSKKHPDHPDVAAVEALREQRAELAAADVDDNPFAEEPDKKAEVEPTVRPARRPVTAPTSTETKE